MFPRKNNILLEKRKEIFMRRKFFKRITALAVSVAMLIPTNVHADLKREIYVGDVVSISAKDLQVKNNYKSMDEITKEYTQDTGGITSNNTLITSSDGKHLTGSGNSIIDAIITDEDLTGKLPNKTKKTLSYDEFLKLIKNQDSETKKKFEKARKNAQDKQKKANKEAAEKIKKAIEDAEKGINPVTGEPINEGDNFYEDIKKSDKDFLEWLKDSKWTQNNEINNSPTIEEDNLGNISADEYYQAMLDYKKDLYRKYAENGDQDKIKDLRRIDESEYLNDTLVYKKDKGNYRDIKYRCATCGKTYGFNEFCDCGKIFANKVQKHFYDNKSMFEQFFGSFNDDGNAKTGNLLSSEIKCSLCGKKLTTQSIDPKNLTNDEYGFEMGSNGMILCHNCRKHSSSNGTTYDDESQWAEFNPYWDNFIIPAKSDTIAKNTIDESDIEDFRNSMTDAEKKYFDEIMDKKNLGQYPNSDAQAKALDDFVKKYKEYLKHFTDISDGSSSTWTEEEKKNMRDAINQLRDKGIPPTTSSDKDTQKIKDTKEYEDNFNKIFKDWEADREKWTTGQKEFYEKMKKKLENDSGMKATLDDIVDKGIISKDKTPEQIIKGIDDYIASFTSIDENVTINVTVDSIGDETHGNKKNYTVQGDVLLSLIGSDGTTLVSDYQISDSIGYRFCPDQPGKYILKRKVRIYDIEWQIVYQTYDIKAEMKLPDGSTELLSEKQVTRIREDKSGLKSSNMRELSAPDITITVKPRVLDIDKKDFYDTERIS